MLAKNLKIELRKFSSLVREEKNRYFFKTGIGGYSENDKFIGVSVPDNRKISNRFLSLSFSQLEILLHSEIHEERLSALIILSERAKKAKKRDRKELEILTMFYLKNKQYVNNWDLVDTSAHYILGNYILEYPEKRIILDKLVISDNLWERRVAIVSTWVMIRENKIDETIYLAEKLLSDKEDLIHKAVGWMLREAWKKDSKIVESFLYLHYSKIPRTTLRYTIERMEKERRISFLKGDFSK